MTSNNSQPYVANTSSQCVNADEFAIATLKNGIVTNTASREDFLNEETVLTNKRLYYNCKKGIINVHVSQNQLDIQDITGSKISSHRPWGILIVAAILIITYIIRFIRFYTAISRYPIVPSHYYRAIGPIWLCFFATIIIAIILFICRSKKRLRIEYPDGHISFSVKKYSMQNVITFQNCIYSCKDKLKDSN